jgi:hypothetical protein
MKNIMIGLFVFYNIALQAQPRTFLPDTLNILNGHTASGLDIVSLANSQYAILTRDDNLAYATFVVVDSIGQQIENREFRTFGNNKYIFPAVHSFLQFKNKDWLLPTLAQTVGVYNNYNALLIFNETLDSVKYKQLSKTMFQGNYLESTYGWATYNNDSTSIWILGGTPTPTMIFTATVTHLDSTAHTFISDYVLDRFERYISPRWITSTSDGNCIISGEAQWRSGNFANSSKDQVFIAKVGDNGLQWYRELGAANNPDYDGYVFKGTTDSTYRLIYARARGYDPVIQNIAIDLYSIEFNNAGAVVDSGQIMAINNYARIWSHLQLPDGSIILGLYAGGYYSPRLVKFSRSGQLLWTSMIPQPQVGQYTAWGIPAPVRVLPTPDGGFLCTGRYSNYQHTPETTVWVGKMDSTGCWENCIVATSPSPPSGDLGGIRVFPNPTTDLLHLENLPNRASIKLYDIVGNSLTFQQDGNAISLKNLPNGLYFCSIFVNSHLVQTLKIVKTE